MRGSSTTNLDFEAALGRIDGVVTVDRFSENGNIDPGTVPEDIWAVGGVYTYLTEAAHLRVMSADAADTEGGSGARAALVQGLNGNYEAVEERVELRGVTPVVTTQSYIRVHDVTMVEVGASGGNVGEVTVDSGLATPLLARIAPLDNRTLLSHFTIPRNHVGLIRRLFFSAPSADGVSVQLLYRPFGMGFIPLRRMFVFQSHVTINVDSYLSVLPEKTDIKLNVLAVSLVNTKVTGGYDLLLIDRAKV